jgi:hypothetical protein
MDETTTRRAGICWFNGIFAFEARRLIFDEAADVQFLLVV